MSIGASLRKSKHSGHLQKAKPVGARAVRARSIVEQAADAQLFVGARNRRDCCATAHAPRRKGVPVFLFFRHQSSLDEIQPWKFLCEISVPPLKYRLLFSAANAAAR